MAYNNGNDWSYGQGDDSRNSNSQGSFRRQSQYAPNFNAFVAQPDHEIAWRQQANGRPISYQNGPQHNTHYFSQMNNSDTQHHDANNHFQPQPEPPPPPKRASKRRFRHDVPGPAGAWFQLQKRKSKRNGNNTQDDNRKESQAIKSNPEEVTSSTNAESKPDESSKSTRVQLFKDYSTKLHDCNAWNLMCQTHERIIPPFHSFIANLSTEDKNNTNAAASQFRRLLRNIVPRHQSLIHEIQSGKYDIHHLSPSVHTNDLRVPLLFGYVSHISCHTHSDWTAVLVDESYSCGGRNNRGVTCWLEERLVKRHPSWIRPGVVWMVEGAKLALFASKEEQSFDEDNCNGDGGGMTNDISPSTEAARGGYAIDRMILVGEDSLVYAWTPEEALQHFLDGDYTKLLERRCNVDFESGLETAQVDIVEGGFSEVQQNSLSNEKSEPRASSVLTEQSKSKSQEGQKIGSALSLKDDDGINHSVQDSAQVSASLGASQNDHFGRSIVDSAAIQSVVGEHKNQVTNMFQEQHASQQQSAPRLSIAGKSVQGTAAVQTGNDLNGPTAAQNKRTSQSKTTNVRASLASESTRHRSSGDFPPACAPHDLSASLQNTTRPNPYTKSSVAFSSSVPNLQGCFSTSKSFTSPKLSSSAVHTKSAQTGNSFDTSLDIDDDQLFYINNQSLARAKQNEEVNHQRQKETAPTLPPVAMSNNESNVSTHGDTRSVGGATPKTSRIKTPGSVQCPSTGDSFDDSLDINEDELFYTGNHKTSKTSQQALGTRHSPESVHDNNALPVNSEGDQRKLASQLALQTTANNTSINKFVSKPASTIFDNFDDDDLDSLGDIE